MSASLDDKDQGNTTANVVGKNANVIHVSSLVESLHIIVHLVDGKLVSHLRSDLGFDPLLGDGRISHILNVDRLDRLPILRRSGEW